MADKLSSNDADNGEMEKAQNHDGDEIEMSGLTGLTEGDDGSDLEMLEDGAESDGEFGESVEELPKEDHSTAKIAAHSKDVFCLAVSPDGQWIASGSEDETAAIWDLRHGITSPVLHRRIAFHADSVHLLAVEYFRKYSRADMAGRIICTPVSVNASESSSLFIDDCLVGSSQKNSAEENEEESSEQICWIFWHSTADGILFSGCKDGSFWMWLIVRSEHQSVLNVHQSKIFTTNSSAPCCAALLLSDAKFLLAAYENSVARIWDLKEANSVEISLPGQCSGTVDANFGANLAAIGCQNGLTALISTAQNPRLLHTFQTNSEQSVPSDESIEVVRFAPDGLTWLAVGTTAGRLSIFDWEKRSSRYECEHDGDAVVSCVWLCDAGRSVSVMSACIDGGIRIWDAKSGEPLALMHGAGEEIYYLCMTKDGDGRVHLFSACANGSVRIFQLAESDLTLAES
ncbi:hypothetical protein GPALN_012916 [Globodera pallida]|nr:hypothetical protein GPALN_012916 [Globodera pallida]